MHTADRYYRQGPLTFYCQRHHLSGEDLIQMNHPQSPCRKFAALSPHAHGGQRQRNSSWNNKSDDRSYQSGTVSNRRRDFRFTQNSAFRERSKPGPPILIFPTAIELYSIHSGRCPTRASPSDNKAPARSSRSTPHPLTPYSISDDGSTTVLPAGNNVAGPGAIARDGRPLPGCMHGLHRGTVRIRVRASR